MGDVVFNLVCVKALDERVLHSVSDLQDVEDFLRDMARNAAADEVQRFREEVERINSHLHSLGVNIYALLDAAEHWAAEAKNDNRRTHFDTTWAEHLAQKGN